MLINYFEKEERTAVLLITPISCACFYMEGSNLYDYLSGLGVGMNFLFLLLCLFYQIKAKIHRYKGKAKYQDKWIHNGWIIHCSDDYKTSFEYNLDMRFERLADGKFRKWFTRRKR